MIWETVVTGVTTGSELPLPFITDTLSGGQSKITMRTILKALYFLFIFKMVNTSKIIKKKKQKSIRAFQIGG